MNPPEDTTPIQSINVNDAPEIVAKAIQSSRHFVAVAQGNAAAEPLLLFPFSKEKKYDPDFFFQSGASALHSSHLHQRSPGTASIPPAQNDNQADGRLDLLVPVLSSRAGSPSQDADATARRAIFRSRGSAVLACYRQTEQGGLELQLYHQARHGRQRPTEFGNAARLGND